MKLLRELSLAEYVATPTVTDRLTLWRWLAVMTGTTFYDSPWDVELIRRKDQAIKDMADEIEALEARIARLQRALDAATGDLDPARLSEAIDHLEPGDLDPEEK